MIGITVLTAKYAKRSLFLLTVAQVRLSEVLSLPETPKFTLNGYSPGWKLVKECLWFIEKSRVVFLAIIKTLSVIHTQV